MRSVFFGTPASAIPSLAALLDVTDVELVITQPDRPRGRSGAPVAPSVKRAAEQWGLRILQPNNKDELWGELSQLAFEVGLVVAYGKILEPRVLELASLGYLNVHFSLLPRWRGAAPVERAILAGDEKTGVSLMVLDEGLDTGPVIAAVETPIADDETGGSLTGRLSYLGGMLVDDAVPDYLAGQLQPAPQIDAGVTNALMLDPDEARIDGGWAAETVESAVRAFHPRPGAWLMIDGVRHKVLEVERTDSFVEPGSVEAVDGEPAAGFTGGSLLLVALQPAGRPVQSGSAWLNGRRGSGGTIDPA
ncbi:MAG: methionyl-tRNA formyltransferase [Acidimicrobiia bacterium]|nr:MAG: methionyl-tRNA formyltransferase [Acidimicrobiia bacterium]